MKNVLIVDSDTIALHTFAGLVQSQGGLIKVFTANSRQAALNTIEKECIDLVITGIRLAEEDGFKLIAQLGKDHPDIRVIVMTHNASSIFRAEIKQSPSAVNFDQVEDVSMLSERIFTELHIEYGGRIRGVSLSSFLQMMELEKCSCRLTVSAKVRSGRITLRRGAPYLAKTEDLTGDDAVLEMLTWENIGIDIDYTLDEQPRNVSDSLVSLIMESGRRIDENKMQKKDQRSHRRFSCLVAVDYDISDWTYQCFLKDISEGGAYIETSHPIKAGQNIMLTLCSPIRNHNCIIKGEVVRKDDDGIGVRFDSLDPEHQQVILDLSAGFCQ